MCKRKCQQTGRQFLTKGSCVSSSHVLLQMSVSSRCRNTRCRNRRAELTVPVCSTLLPVGTQFVLPCGIFLVLQLTCKCFRDVVLLIISKELIKQDLFR